MNTTNYTPCVPRTRVFASENNVYSRLFVELLVHFQLSNASYRVKFSSFQNECFCDKQLLLTKTLRPIHPNQYAKLTCDICNI